MKTIQSAKPGQIYYAPIGKIRVIRVLNRYEGYKEDSGYEDPNGDTVEFYDFIEKKKGKMNTRSVPAQRFYWDEGGKSPDIDIGFSDRHAHIIKRIFEDYG